MATLYENLLSLCQERGIKGAKMCNDLGISKSMMTDLKNGRKKSVSAETAQKLADYFGVTVGYLLGSDTEKEKTTTSESGGFSEKDVRLMEWFRSLPEEKRRAILSLGGAPEDLIE